MKKILLTLIVLLTSYNCFSQNKLDSAKVDIEKTSNIKVNDLRIYLGIQPGIQVFRKDSALVSMMLPLGYNFRHYFNDFYHFFDVDLSANFSVLYTNHFTTFAKLSVGAGLVNTYYNMEIHISYLHSFLGYSPLYGIGYDFETQSLPISLDFLKFFDRRDYLLMIGTKIPITDFRL